MNHSGPAREASGLRLRRLACAAAVSAMMLGSAAVDATTPRATVTRVPRPRRTAAAAAQEPQQPSGHASAQGRAHTTAKAPAKKQHSATKSHAETGAGAKHTPHRRHHSQPSQNEPVEMKRAAVGHFGHAPAPPLTAAQANDELQRAIDADAAQMRAQTEGQTEASAATQPAAAAPPDPAELAHPTHQQLAEDAAQPVVLPGLYRNGRLIVPAPLKGSHEVLVHQNLMADDEGLERIVDNQDLSRLRAAHELVNFPESASLRVNPELAADRRCARAWTVRFAADIARQYYARFQQPLMVNSAVRTVAYQLRLQRTNGNAAGVGGEVASPHLTGQAIDLGKGGMSTAQIAWMRAYLKPLMDAGKLDVEEEFQQACFHISVYRSYLPPAKKLPQKNVAQLTAHRAETVEENP